MSTYNWDDETLLKPGEVAHLFRVDPKTVTRWAKGGRFPRGADGRPATVKTLGGHARFRFEVIRKILDGELELEPEIEPLHSDGRGRPSESHDPSRPIKDDPQA